MPPHPLIQLRRVSKSYGSQQVVRDLDLEVQAGEFLTLLGASGSGKTTTLRMIGGFEQPSSGDVLLEGVCVNDLPPYSRNVNTVFQNYALFPHMTVFDNVAFGLRMKRLPRGEIASRVSGALEMVKLEGLEARLPRQLSGGQQQRVSLARAIVNQPKALLLDEPLGALDLKLRRAMQLELKELQRKLGIAFLYVTHDQEEALTMSDRVALLHHGRLVQIGSPEEIYHQPRTRFVADFIGETNLIAGTVVACDSERVAIDTPAGRITAAPGRTIGERRAVEVAVRPEAIRLCDHPPDGDRQANAVRVRLASRIFVGSTTRYRLQSVTGGLELIMHSLERKPALDREGWAVWDAAETVLLLPGED